jgi:hypothetical protein
MVSHSRCASHPSGSFILTPPRQVPQHHYYPDWFCSISGTNHGFSCGDQRRAIGPQNHRSWFNCLTGNDLFSPVQQYVDYVAAALALDQIKHVLQYRQAFCPFINTGHIELVPTSLSH